MTDRTGRPARRWPWWLALGVVAVLVVVAVAVEWGGRVGVDRLAADRIARDVPAGSVEVVTGSAWWRPTIIPAVVLGDLDRISVRLVDTDLGGFSVAVVDYVLEGVAGDVSLPQRRVTVRSIDHGMVRMLVDPSAFAVTFGTTAELVDRQLLIGPERIPASFEIVGDDLVVSVGDGTEVPDQVIPVVDDWLMPCRPEVRTGNRYIELACDGDELPGVLGGSFSSGDLRDGGVGGKDPDAERPPPDLLPPETVDRSAPDSTTDSTAPDSTAPDSTGGAGGEGDGGG